MFIVQWYSLLLTSWLVFFIFFALCQTIRLLSNWPSLGMPDNPKTDKFSEKFQTAFAPPPPPPPPHFRKIILQFFSPKFMTEVSSTMAKICNIFFWIENDPPPLPFGTFPKIHPFWMCQASLNVTFSRFYLGGPPLSYIHICVSAFIAILRLCLCVFLWKRIPWDHNVIRNKNKSPVRVNCLLSSVAGPHFLPSGKGINYIEHIIIMILKKAIKSRNLFNNSFLFF